MIDERDASLLDVIDSLLNKGVVVNGEVMLSLAGVDLVYLRLSVLLCAADKVLRVAADPPYLLHLEFVARQARDAPLVILGFVGIGAMNSAVLLARTAAADMYPEDRKARAISYVLFGALFGAAVGPLVFRPLFAGKDLERDR